MRVILKPLGAVLFLVVIAVLSVLAVISGRNPQLKLGEPESTATPLKLVYPSGGRVLVSSDPEQWLLVTPSEKQGTLVPQTDNGKKGMAFTVSIPGTLPQVHMVKIQRIVNQPAQHDSLVKVHFAARSKDSAKLTVLYWQQTPTEIKMSETQLSACDLYRDITLTPDWKEYTLEFRLKRDYSPRTSALTFQPGQANANYEFSEVTVNDYGPSAQSAQ